MSHLILDIGNTHAKAAIVADGNIVELRVADSAAQLSLSELCNLHNVDRAIASVVGRQPDFASLLPARIRPCFHQLSHRSRLPITLEYDTPHTLGMDRVAAAVGARELEPDGALLIVDAGSCITVDLLDDQNRFQGGAILPGIHMRFNALHQFTAALPAVTLTPEEYHGQIASPITGKNTRDSIIAGVCSASLFEIQGFIESYRREYPSLKLFLTGGDADFFANRLFFPKFATPSLLIRGLDKILIMNT